VELGCGIGWISLALAKQTRPFKIYGLDINPKAILCSKINLYLNAFDQDGKPTWEHEGNTLLNCVEFHLSDLLEFCRNHKILVDRIIGCIPQVLNPDPEFTSKIIARRSLEQANDEFLYSLSNYTADQGFLEDQFGLGLIARALEESVDVLRVSGKIILNLGGRPGSTVLQNLFLRRGFTVRSVWQTQVTQAKDTDIQSLVAIEEKTPHRFEFYMGQGIPSPISAKTALAYAEAGGEISHSLTVHEAQMRDPLHLPKILQFMRQKGYEDARHSIDLSFTEDALALEKMSFLHSLTESLQAGAYFPYEETAGVRKLRERLASFFRNYFRLSFQESHFLVTPSRGAVCRNVLMCYRPKRALIDSYLASLIGLTPEMIEIPKNAELLCELMDKLKPEIVIYSMPISEADVRESFLQMVEVARKSGTRLFIDISDWVELSSNPRNNAVFRYLAQNRLPTHVSLICGLVKNRLYRDLEVCFLISENHTVISHLESAAELTYSRTPVISQLYYDRILQELINFQILDLKSIDSISKKLTQEEQNDFKNQYIQLSSTANEAFSHAAIAAEGFARNPDLIRLDYGENCLPTPKAVQESLFESFAKMQISQEESDCTPEVLSLMQRRFGIDPSSNPSMTLGDGVAPLFAEIAHFCSEKNYRFIFPSGTYGHFVASAQFHGTPWSTVSTQEHRHFKLDPKALDQTLSSTSENAWIVLSAPLVNPTGALYTTSELEAIFEIALRHQAVLILDSIFSGLDFSPTESETKIRLKDFPSLRWIIFGGISKEFAAGGLRVGYGVSSDPEVKHLWSLDRHHTPHSTLKFTLKHVYKKLLQLDPELSWELNHQRQELKKRSADLFETLKKTGWDPIPPSGGLFLIAKPKDPHHIDCMDQILREQSSLVINPPSWTGIPGYYRFVISPSQEHFQEALKRLRTRTSSSS
jgi:methionine S-methyltransferase